MSILGYTIYKRGETLSTTEQNFECKGIYLTKEHAENAMMTFINSYCIKKVGIENYVENQINDPSLANSIKDGFVLTRQPNGEIKVFRRTPGYVSYYEHVHMYCGIVALPKNDLEISLPDGKFEVVKDNVDEVGFIQVVRRGGASDTSSKEKKKIQQYNAPKDMMKEKGGKTILEQLKEELEVELERRKLKKEQECKNDQSCKDDVIRDQVIPKVDQKECTSEEMKPEIFTSTEEKPACNESKVCGNFYEIATKICEKIPEEEISALSSLIPELKRTSDQKEILDPIQTGASGLPVAEIAELCSLVHIMGSGPVKYSE